MRGPIAVLILVVGWVIMYFVLTQTIPRHLREQTEEMPGTRPSSTSIVDGPEPAPPMSDTPPASREPVGPEEIRLLIEAPPGGSKLGLVVLEIYKEGTRSARVVSTSILADGARLEHDVAVPDPDASYRVRAVAQDASHPLWGPAEVTGVAPGGAPARLRLAASRSPR